MKLGIDVGRVLISPGNDLEPDTSFIGGSLEDALETPPYPGMFEVVPRLVERFKGEVWVISKCGPKVQEKTRQWMRHHRFFERTGIDAANLRFCLRRPEKAIHCKELEITHFIDDRSDVLAAMEGIVPNLFLFGPQRDEAPQGFKPVLTWADVGTALCVTAPAAGRSPPPAEPVTSRNTPADRGPRSGPAGQVSNPTLRGSCGWRRGR